MLLSQLFLHRVHLSYDTSIFPQPKSPQFLHSRICNVFLYLNCRFGGRRGESLGGGLWRESRGVAWVGVSGGCQQWLLWWLLWICVALAHPELRPVHLPRHLVAVLRQHIAKRRVNVAQDPAEPDLGVQRVAAAEAWVDHLGRPQHREVNLRTRRRQAGDG